MGTSVFQEKNKSRDRVNRKKSHNLFFFFFFFFRSSSSTLTLDKTKNEKKKHQQQNSPASGPNRARILAEIREENDWKTDFVLGKKAGAALR